MNQIIVGSACTFRPGHHFIEVLDPHGSVVGTVRFTNGEAAANFASAAGIASSVTFDHEGVFDYAASEGANQ